MNITQKHRPKLQLVAPSQSVADADWIASRVMEQLDKTMPDLFTGRPLGARASARNIIVRALLAEASKR
ncbi:hypothetical protein [Variovorax paradoxus]|uniref:hypothetical protein n=1 Tax=Variovorax paradoxus TaxID=34073 RepID=UPI001ABBF3EB